MKRLLMLTGALLLAALAGCGGSGGESDGTTPEATFASATEDPRGLPTTTAAEATAAATVYELELYRHEGEPFTQGSDVINFPYEVSLPKGWVLTSSGQFLTAELPKPGSDLPFALFGMECRPSVTAQEMLELDGGAAERLNLGNLASQERIPVLVGGKEAIRVDWVGSAFPAEHSSVYVDGKSCAWRLQISVLGGLRPSDFRELFDRILEAFNPDQGLPDGFQPGT